MSAARVVEAGRLFARARPLTAVAAPLVFCAVIACSSSAADTTRIPRSTLVIGIDVSGSFDSRGRYDSAIDFTANYLYAHIHGLGGLKQPTAVFVGSFGG